MRINKDYLLGCAFWGVVSAFAFCAAAFYGVRWLVNGQWVRGLLLVCVGCSGSGLMLRALWDVLTE